MTGSTPDGVRSSVIFRSGVLVGTLSFQGPNGHVPPVPLAKLAAAFAARIEAATFTGRPYDVAHVMSAVVPRAGLPSAFAPLGWDLAWSGCWDHAALIGNSADPAAIAEDIAKYGVEVYCLGMYSPLGDCGPRWCPSPDPAMTSTVGIIRVATGVTVLASAADAQGYRASSLARIEATSGRTALEHFEVPGMTGAVGLRRHVKDGDLAQVDTRVVFVHGDVVAVAYVHDKTEADHRDQVVEMAKALDARLDEVLEDSRP